MQPDMNDPAYSAYSAWRREQSKARAMKRPTTEVAPQESLAQSIARAREESVALGITSGSAKTAASLILASLSGPAAAGSGIASTLRANSVLEAFELAAYWQMKGLIDAVGKKEGELRPDVLRYCDYIRSGDHARHYILKPEYRTPKCPVPDPVDERNRVAAT